jgi:hypothetical protein
MSFMELQVTPKGALYSADCGKCCATIYVHEWATWDCNAERDALRDGTLECPHCNGKADPDTFTSYGRKHYAARYSAPGYMDCTDWSYGTNRRALIREVRDMYGEG